MFRRALPGVPCERGMASSLAEARRAAATGGATCANAARAFSVSFLDSASATLASSARMLPKSASDALVCGSSCLLSESAAVCRPKRRRHHECLRGEHAQAQRMLLYFLQVPASCCFCHACPHVMTALK